MSPAGTLSPADLQRDRPVRLWQPAARQAQAEDTARAVHVPTSSDDSSDTEPPARRRDKQTRPRRDGDDEPRLSGETGGISRDEIDNAIRSGTPSKPKGGSLLHA